jgi:shikimate dehydrogenase
MHNAAFAACGLNWAYLAFPVAPGTVATAVHGLAAAGIAGLNVTIPHKHEVIDACSAVSDAVTAIGAANTLIPDGAGGFRADNTDAAGFLRAIDEQAPLDLQGARVLIIGAGGASRAVVYALRLRGAEPIIANRTQKRAEALGQTIPFTDAALRSALDECSLIVNATSLGMGSNDVPAALPLDGIGPHHVVNDLVYRIGGTPWLHAAAARGARTVDGLGMLLYQGAAAFEQWTGRPAPIDAMRAALEAGD